MGRDDRLAAVALIIILALGPWFYCEHIVPALPPSMLDLEMSKITGERHEKFWVLFACAVVWVSAIHSLVMYICTIKRNRRNRK